CYVHEALTIAPPIKSLKPLHSMHFAFTDKSNGEILQAGNYKTQKFLGGSKEHQLEGGKDSQ
ncbi:MAG: hypothetical protein V7L04_00790, partial [Nostoc sp.]|uniref:hypothetical protein n=1 Tax=Nostoc sp. TaxID=1180 RepID=UPI002FFA7245